MNIYDFALELFRTQVIKKRGKLKKLHKYLISSKMHISSEKYYALTLFSIFISLTMSMIVITFIHLLSGFTIKKLVLNIILPFLIAGGVGGFIYYYPKFKADARKKKIENALSFTTIYLTTMAESSILPKDMFRLIGDLKEYGEISKEAREISEDINALGLDLPSAINRAIKRSPSSEWSEFLSGFKTTIVSGGDLISYLKEKTRGYTAEYKKKLVEFGKMLGMLIQIYLTVVGIGTVFFIVISSLMGVIGGISTVFIKTIQYMIIVVGIPMVTILMIIVIRSISPINVK